MSRRLAAVIGAVSLVAAGLAWFLLRPAPDEPFAPEAEEPLPPVEDVEPVPVTLYFPGEDDRLHAETREILPVDDPAARVGRLVEALLEGPRGEGLRAPLPAGVDIGRAYLLEDSTVILDLVSPDAAPPPPMGSRVEMLTVYTLVNTVLRNTEGSERLILLWNGRQSSTFAGHVDTGHPLFEKPELHADEP